MENEWILKIERLEKDLALNAAMLAKQCDMAREAEIKADLYRNTLEAVKICSSIPVAIRIIDEVLETDPDITITCRSTYGEEIVQDAVKAMESLIPTKYKFSGHVYCAGVHTLTYRRA